MTGSAFGGKKKPPPKEPWWKANEGKKPGCNDKSIRTPLKKERKPRDPYGM